MSRQRRVVLGTTAIFVGAAASLACLAVILMVVFGSGIHPAAVAFATLLYGCIPAVALAFICGAPLAVLLHPVRNQWLHVLAFAGLGALLGVVLAALIRISAGHDPAFMAIVAGIMGFSTAIGRLAVWKLARIDGENMGSGLGPPSRYGDLKPGYQSGSRHPAESGEMTSDGRIDL